MTEIGQMAGALLLVLSSLFGGVFFLRRLAPHIMQRYQTAEALQHLGLLTLTPQCSVALVRARQDILVLGLTPQTVTLLTKATESASLDGREIAKRGESEKGKTEQLTRREGEAA